MNKKDRDQHKRNAQFRAWKATKWVGNGLGRGLIAFERAVGDTLLLPNRPRLAHLFYQGAATVQGGVIVVCWVPPHLGPGWFQMILTMFIFLFVVVNLSATQHGQRAMCEQCMDWSFPHDGDARTQKCMRRLKFWHFKRSKVILWSTVLIPLWIASLFFTKQWVFGASVISGIWGQTLFLTLYCDRPHRQLRYWCPWCREGDGALAPDPELDRVA